MYFKPLNTSTIVNRSVENIGNCFHMKFTKIVVDDALLWSLTDFRKTFIMILWNAMVFPCWQVRNFRHVDLWFFYDFFSFFTLKHVNNHILFPVTPCSYRTEYTYPRTRVIFIPFLRGVNPLPKISGKCFEPHPDMSIFRPIQRPRIPLC